MARVLGGAMREQLAFPARLAFACLLANGEKRTLANLAHALIYPYDDRIESMVEVRDVGCRAIIVRRLRGRLAELE